MPVTGTTFIFTKGENRGSHQFLNWWRQMSTGHLHLDGFDLVHLRNINKREADASLLFMVPVTGIEPVRFLRRGILSYHSYVEGNGMYIHVKESKSCVESTAF